MRKSTYIWPFSQEVKGRENPITTAPEKATNSKVPTTGVLKLLRITSATVSSIMKIKAAPEITFIHLLSLDAINSSPCMHPPS